MESEDAISYSSTFPPLTGRLWYIRDSEAYVDPRLTMLPKMISQGTSATSTEKTVINTYNSKLATRIASFQAANAGVC